MLAGVLLALATERKRRASEWVTITPMTAVMTTATHTAGVTTA
jgi:hypothetical protein